METKNYYSEKVFTEKDYSVRKIWLLKQGIPALVLSFIYFVIFGIFGIAVTYMLNEAHQVILMYLSLLFFLILVLLPEFSIVFNILSFFSFRYSIGEQYITFSQGFILKETRNLTYSDIRNVSLYRSFLDRIFGLAALTIETNSPYGSPMDAHGYRYVDISEVPKNPILRTIYFLLPFAGIPINPGAYIYFGYEILGFQGNKIHVPGLKKGEVEELRIIIMQKIK
jgi:membrane protein YdbS with pleckstrin-like domain